jgi:hypothetical protein
MTEKVYSERMGTIWYSKDVNLKVIMGNPEVIN